MTASNVAGSASPMVRQSARRFPVFCDRSPRKSFQISKGSTKASSPSHSVITRAISWRGAVKSLFADNQTSTIKPKMTKGAARNAASQNGHLD